MEDVHFLMLNLENSEGSTGAAFSLIWPYIAALRLYRVQDTALE
jgi:hypothetical protein